MTLDQLIAIATPAALTAIWLIRLEGRVNGHDRELRDVKDDVRYIRARIDAALSVHGEYR